MSMNYIDRLTIYCMRSLDNIWSKPSWYFKGYSDYWRITRSNSESIELARILRSLSMVVGHLGMNIGRVVWSGQVDPELDRGSIILPPEFVLDDYPVPIGKMDVLVGVTIHEALRQTEWSENVWREILNKKEEINKPANFYKKDALWQLYAAGENIYLDKRVSGNILGDYTKKARKALIPSPIRNLSRNPVASCLFDIWEQAVLDDAEFPNLNPLYSEPLNRLCQKTDGLFPIAGDKQNSVILRSKDRAGVYLDIWNDIDPLIQEWEHEPASYFEKGTTEQRVKKKKRKKKDADKKKQQISQDIWDEIDLELSVGGRDLTPLIKKICNNDDKVLRTTLSDFTIPAYAETDRQLVRRLKNVFQYYAQKVKKTSRGLESGKIDRRRLYRAPIDGKCFKIDQMLSEFAWNFNVVVDASMSMAGFKWRVVENTMSALYKSLESFKNSLRIFGYFEWDGVCVISELLRKSILYSIAPSGRTPSGQAIIAAALLMPKETKGKKFILHITDGESNAGVDVKYALDYCKEEKIDIITLGCGYKDKDVLFNQYGKQLQFLDTIDELPKAIERLFQRILKY